MPKEKSCGAIVFRRTKKEPLFLLLHYEKGHWDYPKGHIEEGEVELETVQREVEEETGITDLQFVPDFKEKISYFFKKEGKIVFKEVSFYLIETKQENVRLSLEHIGFKWLPFEKALEQLTYNNAKQILKKANEFLKQKKVSEF